MVKRLGEDGRCDPSHDTLAADAGCCSRTVRRACAAMRMLGILRWECRLVRADWRAEQTSNAYELVPAAVLPIAAPTASRCGGQAGRETRSTEILFVPLVAPDVAAAAQAALALRRATVESRLTNKRMTAGGVR